MTLTQSTAQFVRESAWKRQITYEAMVEAGPNHVTEVRLARNYVKADKEHQEALEQARAEQGYDRG